MKYLKSIWFIGLLILSIQLQAQSPYQLNWKTDGSLATLGVVSAGLGIYFRSNITEFTPSDLENLNANDVNAFDRIATDYYSPSASKASDYFWASSHTLPLLFLTGEKSRKNFGIISAMYGEVLLITSGLTLLTKSTIKRTRPFVYNPNAPLDKKLTKTARSAFFSGHTSITAANCFFAATVFSDIYPDSKWKSTIWASAALIPAITGYLRVRAGKHYPTDTMAGYILGATIGFLVPKLHKKKMEKISFYGGPGGMLVQVRF